MRKRFSGEKKTTHVLFSTDGKGNWWRREWQAQCSERVFLADECQGVAGHKGNHWCYKADGSYSWSVNRKETGKLSDYDICSGQTPPDHKEYKNPVKMCKHHHLNFYKDSKVTDPKEIARLEKGKMKANESYTAPVSQEEMKRLGLDKRVAQIKKRKKK